MTSVGWRLRTSTTGARATRSFAMTRWKIGVSRMPSRTHKPIPTMTRLSQNGTRHPPAQKLIGGHPAERQDREVGEEETGRRAQLRPGREEPAIFARACPLHRHQHRAAPFTADTDPLNEAQYDHHDRAPDADLFVGRDASDQKGRQAGKHPNLRIQVLVTDRFVDLIAEGIDLAF